MLAKLGHLGYWLGCGLAVVALVSGVYVLQHGLDQDPYDTAHQDLLSSRGCDGGVREELAT